MHQFFWLRMPEDVEGASLIVKSVPIAYHLQRDLNQCLQHLYCLQFQTILAVHEIFFAGMLHAFAIF